MKLAKIAHEQIAAISTKDLIALKKSISLVRKDLIHGDSIFICNSLYNIHYSKYLIKYSQYSIFKQLIKYTLHNSYKCNSDVFDVFDSFDTLYRLLNQKRKTNRTEALKFRLGWLAKLNRYINIQLKQRS